jgi:glycosyltransferase involved in cell wall biosynthesis
MLTELARMKILRCVRSLDPATGGPTESIKQSSIALAQRGHNVEIVSLDAPDSPWLGEFPATVLALGPGRGSYGYSHRFVPWLKDRHSHYDAVIVHGLWQYTSFGVWRALHGSTTPYFVFPHGMLDPWFNRTYPLKHVKKLFYWPWAEYRVLRDAAAVLFTSEQERLLARKSFSPYRCNEVVVNYGTAAPDVDLANAREDFLNAFPQLRGKRFLVFLGRLHEKKGCDLLIQSFTTISDPAMQLIIAGPSGDRDYVARLQSLAADWADSIIFSGMLRDKLKWGALAAADAFILPSHQENFGIAVAEALACGTPVLLSNQVNIWREIVEGGAGFADEDNVAGITRLLRRWLNTPAAEREKMRTAARNCFTRRFEINRATDSLLSILEKFARR